MSLASSSGERVGSVPAEGVAGVISLTGASLVHGRLLGIGSVGCTRHPSKKYLPAKVGFPVQAGLRHNLPSTRLVQS